MNIQEIAVKYLTQILNSKKQENVISKIVDEIKTTYPNDSNLIFQEIRKRLVELGNRQRKLNEGYERRSFEFFQQSNDNYLEYLAFLNKSIEGKGK